MAEKTTDARVQLGGRSATVRFHDKDGELWVSLAIPLGSGEELRPDDVELRVMHGGAELTEAEDSIRFLSTHTRGVTGQRISRIELPKGAVLGQRAMQLTAEVSLRGDADCVTATL